MTACDSAHCPTQRAIHSPAGAGGDEADKIGASGKQSGELRAPLSTRGVTLTTPPVGRRRAAWGRHRMAQIGQLVICRDKGSPRNGRRLTVVQLLNSLGLVCSEAQHSSNKLLLRESSRLVGVKLNVINSTVNNCHFMKVLLLSV